MRICHTEVRDFDIARIMATSSIQTRSCVFRTLYTVPAAALGTIGGAGSALYGVCALATTANLNFPQRIYALRVAVTQLKRMCALPL